MDGFDHRSGEHLEIDDAKIYLETHGDDENWLSLCDLMASKSA